jgi:Ca2+ transporting ATPase
LFVAVCVHHGLIVYCVQIRGSDIACDESALTGESEEVKKSAEKNPFLLSGTAVMKGTGSMLVTCVGLFSEEGIVQKLITGVGQEEVCV